VENVTSTPWRRRRIPGESAARQDPNQIKEDGAREFNLLSRQEIVRQLHTEKIQIHYFPRTAEQSPRAQSDET